MKLRFAAIAVLLVSLLAAAAASAQDAGTLSRQAVEAYLQKDWVRSADLFAAAVEAGADDPDSLYNAACSSALAGRPEAASGFLERSVAAGYGNVEGLKKDADLTSLHADPRWAALVERMEKAARLREALWNNPALATPYRPSLPEDERIAGLSRLWSEVKFNFANFDLVPDLDWDALYMAYLPRVRQAGSTLAYYRLLMEMAAKLRDGHTGVYPPDELDDEVYARPPVRVVLVEGRPFVSHVFAEALQAEGIRPGVEIVAIDGIPVKQYAETRVAPYQSASTPHDLAARTYENRLLAGSSSAPVELTLQPPAGEAFRRKVARMPAAERNKLAATPPMELRMLPGNVAYIALNGFDDNTAAEQFEARFEEIAKADALILDVRANGGGNSDVGYRVLACLTDKPFRTSRWRTRDYRPAYRAWGRAEGTFGGDADELQPSGTRLYTKPVVVLTGPRTYSAAEDFVVAFDAMKRGKIVGEPTGGSTGQPLQFKLPGGGMARVCTKRDTYPDDKEFVGVGVQPQVLVQPTVEDFRAGRDTVLEAALALLRNQP
ncbi:MAG: S41 family peptidase [Thermoanaerobaculia bacterium]